MAAPSSEVQSDDTESSLGDSAYEILGASTNLTSDDEDDRDDTMSSVDIHGPDDVHSLAGTEQSMESSLSDCQLDSAGFSPVDVHGGQPGEFALAGDVDDSGVTIKGPDRPSDTVLRFEEPSGIKSDIITVAHTVCPFDDQQRTRILQHLKMDDPPSTIVGTVRQAMSRDVLSIEGPFRLLYVGKASARDDIVAKLASSLAAPMTSWRGNTARRRSSSRFSIVPVSAFGHCGSPEVELIDSVGFEMVVDECTRAWRTRVEGKVDALHLQLNGTSQCHSRAPDSRVVDDSEELWTLPHLAVLFCCNDDAWTTRHARFYAWSFMARHDVPMLVIDESRLYENPLERYTLDPRTLHACIESVKSSPSPSPSTDRILRRLPVDLATFLSVDVRQMNRNLACLTGVRHGRPPANRGTCSSTPQLKVSADVMEKHLQPTADAHRKSRPSQTTHQGRRGLGLFNAIVTFALVFWMLTVMYQEYGWTPLRRSSSYATSQSPSALGAAFSTASEVASNAATRAWSTSSGGSVASSGTRPPGQSHNRDAPQSRKDLANLLLDDRMLTSLNNSDHFKIQIVGDSHIILRPPKKLVALRRPLSLSVKVSRDSRPLDADLSRLFEGVYALKLRRDEAWGLVNVTVSTRARPSVEQTLVADFGRPWLKFGQWRRSGQQLSVRVRGHLGQAQTTFQRTWSWANHDLPTVVGRPVLRLVDTAGTVARLPTRTARMAADAARRISSETRRRRSAVSNSVAEVTGEWSRLVSRQARGVSRVATTLRQIGGRVLQAPVRARKTFTIPRARTQAGRVWRRMWQKQAEDTQSAARRSQTRSCGRRRDGSCKSWW
ncbi:MAG: hypothetical protein M1815_002802 [Lichina confinis]|nr:MAG: hypothetical protein M1815_002802 [Lichina confinis]